jgi:cytochrome oxidase Cu insertion factor (SCO1/SenC/PrrC family)
MPKRTALLLLLACASALPGQASRVLGPVDGAGLAPTDTSRVAVGTVAPDFTLEARTGPPITLSSFRGKKRVILVFYRGHW